MSRCFYLVLRLAFICFHLANGIRVFSGSKPRIVPVSLVMVSLHEFQICYQANSESRGWSNNCPRAT